MTTTQTEPRRSTRQLLEKIPNYPGLYRHSVNKVYYGIKKLAGKRKEHSLDTTDRKIAERRLKGWIADLDKIDPEVERTTLATLLDRFLKTREGMSESTRSTEASLVKRVREDWDYGLDIRVSAIRPSMLDEWLAKQEPRVKNSSYNRFTLFLKQLFELAVSDKILAESPFDRIQKSWKRPEKPVRSVPTDAQFRKIVQCIRAEKQNFFAEESANFIEFMGLAGLGQAEASSLCWGDIDWDKGGTGEMQVRRQKTRALFTVPLYPDLRSFLKRLNRALPEKPAPDALIFKVKDARKALTNACSRLQFPHFSQRNIRAYHIGRMWRAKVDVKLIAKFQGHNDGGKLILNTYTEVFGGNDADYIRSELAKLAPSQTLEESSFDPGI